MQKTIIKKHQNNYLFKIEMIIISIIFLLITNTAFNIFSALEFPKTTYNNLPFGLVEILLIGLGIYSSIKLFKHK